MSNPLDLSHLAGTPYRPSNGTEGEIFMSQWCARCNKDAAHRADPDTGKGCRIIVYSMGFDIGDPNYPKEWVHDETGYGGKCTAFDDTKPLTKADRAYLEWKAKQAPQEAGE